MIRGVVNDVLSGLSGEFEKLYSRTGRPSIAPEKLLRALLLQAFYTIRSERQLMEQLDFNLLFRWFVGLAIDGVVVGRQRVLQEPGPVPGGGGVGATAEPGGATRGGGAACSAGIIFRWTAP